MEHKVKPSLEKTHKEEGIAKRNHRIFGTFRDSKSKQDLEVDINIIKDKTKLSEIPDMFLATVKAEGLF